LLSLHIKEWANFAEITSFGKSFDKSTTRLVLSAGFVENKAKHATRLNVAILCQCTATQCSNSN